MVINPERKGLLRVWLFCLLFFPLTVSLGFWQLDRSEEKQTLLDTQTQLFGQEPLRFDAIGASESNLTLPVSFRPYRLRGHYRSEYFLLDNRMREGRVGYEVLNLFDTDAGVSVLVNRGWVAAPRLRSEFPQVSIPGELVSIEGYFYQPDGRIPVYGAGNIDTLQQAWPKRLQGIDWQAISEQVSSRKFLEREFRLNSMDSPGSLVLDWGMKEISPEKHLGYAVQWFGLSIALLVLTGVYSYRFWAQK